MAAGGASLPAAADAAATAQRAVVGGDAPDRAALETALREAETAIRKRAIG